MLIDTDHLVDLRETAALIGLDNRRGVSVYRRRYEDFPAPAIERGHCVLWLREDVERWSAAHRDRPETEVSHTPLELNLAGMVVGYELEQMLEAAELHQAQPEGPIRNALVESMLVHARALIEFLLGRGLVDSDILPGQLYSGWRRPEGEDLEWLAEQKLLIDRHLAHLTWARVDHAKRAMLGETKGPEWPFGKVAGRLVRYVREFHGQAVAAGRVDVMEEIGRKLDAAAQMPASVFASTVMAATSVTTVHMSNLRSRPGHTSGANASDAP